MRAEGAGPLGAHSAGPTPGRMRAPPRAKSAPSKSEREREDRESIVVPEAGPEPGTTTTSVSPSPDPEPEAGGELAETVRQAEKLFRFRCRSKVAAAARRTRGGLDWVRLAISWAAAADPPATSWGYVLTALDEWESGDGPPPDPGPAGPTADELAAAKLIGDLRGRGVEFRRNERGEWEYFRRSWADPVTATELAALKRLRDPVRAILERNRERPMARTPTAPGLDVRGLLKGVADA